MGQALKELVSLLYGGHIAKWDVSKVRAAGTPLKTFGGRASGPEPLVDLFNFTINTFKNAKGRKLKSIECHDIVCKIAEIVVVGGVRRSSLSVFLISMIERCEFPNQDNGGNITYNGALANNSVNYKEKARRWYFYAREWLSLYDSKSKERGFIAVCSIQKHVEN